MNATYSKLNWIPVSPLFPDGLSCATEGNIKSVLNLKNALYVNSGTAAIYHALKISRIGPGDEVLLPAYLCESMLEAVVDTGAKPVFYKINLDLTVNNSDLQGKISPASKAILIVHFFGFVRRMDQFRSLCDTHNLILIEDCAHAFFGEVSGRPAGSIADYAIASLPKFFPVCEGGVLASARHPLGMVPLKSRRTIDEIKSIFNPLEISAQFRRSRLIAMFMRVPLAIKGVIRKQPASAVASNDVVDDSSREINYVYFNEKEAQRKAGIFSIIVSRLGGGKIQIEKRRSNYRYLHERLMPLRGVRALTIDPGKGFVPYVYPLYVEDSNTIAKFRNRGLPFWMWENIHNDACEISRDYAAHLLQLPCHQSLTGKDLDAMVDCVREIADS